MDAIPAVLTASVQSQTTWRRASAAIVVALVALMAMFSQTVALTIASWSRDPLAHGYVVVPMALLLVWQRRGALTSINPVGGYSGLPLLGIFAFVWLLGNLAGMSIVQQVSLLAMVAGFVWVILGRDVARRLMYPLAFLAFALPIGDRLIPIL